MQTGRVPFCSQCGTDNPDVAKFCFACGSALATAAPAPPTQEVRKVVSIVFSVPEGLDRARRAARLRVAARGDEPLLRRDERPSSSSTAARSRSSSVTPSWRCSASRCATRTATAGRPHHRGMRDALPRIDPRSPSAGRHVWGARPASTPVKSWRVTPPRGAATGHRRHRQRGRPPRAERRQGGGPAREPHVPPRAGPRRGRGGRAARAQGQGRARPGVPPRRVRGGARSDAPPRPRRSWAATPRWRNYGKRSTTPVGRRASQRHSSVMPGWARRGSPRSFSTSPVEGAGAPRPMPAYGDGITYWPLVGHPLGGPVRDDDAPKRLAKILAAVGDADVAGASRRWSASPSSRSRSPSCSGAPAAPRDVGRDRPVVVRIDDVHWASRRSCSSSSSSGRVETRRAVPALTARTSCRREPSGRPGPATPGSCSGRCRRPMPRRSPGTSSGTAGLDRTCATGSSQRPRAIPCSSSSCSRCSSTTAPSSSRTAPGAQPRHRRLRGPSDDRRTPRRPPRRPRLRGARGDRAGLRHRPVFVARRPDHLAPEYVRPELGSHLVKLTDKQLILRDRTRPDEDAYRFHHILIRDTAYDGILKRARANSTTRSSSGPTA